MRLKVAQTLREKEKYQIQSEMQTKIEYLVKKYYLQVFRDLLFGSSLWGLRKYVVPNRKCLHCLIVY